MSDYAPEICHFHLMDSVAPRLAYTSRREFAVWRAQVAAKMGELLGETPPACPLNITIEGRSESEGFSETRFSFLSEPFARVPCHLLVPSGGTGPFPTIICLQGHTSGMHISLGRAKFEGDERMLGGDRDFAIQAVREGFAALVLEQRCFGERRDQR